ncbi:unnamed protein product [Cylicostephanus goldi]|uniref:Uncharacterized protein n=1 Tax=Cylicostephanus goldi TaxID=71465 RepID=A0A3P6RC49_CYLGO|nr:unnamed protein product [Cylicostephanus goldi]
MLQSRDTEGGYLQILTFGTRTDSINGGHVRSKRY